MLSILAEKILRRPGQNPNYPVCILAAPTGKAASIIGKYLTFTNSIYIFKVQCLRCMYEISDGMTLHSAFDFNFNGAQHESLSDKKLAEFRTNLVDLKLIIVDEMSMVDSNKLYKIHMRLCEVLQYDVAELFANVGIVLVGDLLQVCLRYQLV